MNFHKFLKHADSPGLNFYSLPLVFLLMVSPVVALPVLLHPGLLSVKLPRAITSDAADTSLVVVITSENILYVDNKVASLEETRKYVTRGNERPLVIKVDRRASAGRLFEVWDVARNSGVPSISIATVRED